MPFPFDHITLPNPLALLHPGRRETLLPMLAPHPMVRYPCTTIHHHRERHTGSGVNAASRRREVADPAAAVVRLKVHALWIERRCRHGHRGCYVHLRTAAPTVQRMPPCKGTGKESAQRDLRLFSIAVFAAAFDTASHQSALDRDSRFRTPTLNASGVLEAFRLWLSPLCCVSIRKAERLETHYVRLPDPI